MEVPLALLYFKCLKFFLPSFETTRFVYIGQLRLDNHLHGYVFLPRYNCIFLK